MDATTIKNWELAYTEPEIRFLPAIIQFLGYNSLPEPEAHGLAARLKRLRTSLGLSQRGLAEVVVWTMAETPPERVQVSQGRCAA